MPDSDSEFADTASKIDTGSDSGAVFILVVQCLPKVLDGFGGVYNFDNNEKYGQFCYHL